MDMFVIMTMFFGRGVNWCWWSYVFFCSAPVGCGVGAWTRMFQCASQRDEFEVPNLEDLRLEIPGKRAHQCRHRDQHTCINVQYSSVVTNSLITTFSHSEVMFISNRRMIINYKSNINFLIKMWCACIILVKLNIRHLQYLLIYTIYMYIQKTIFCLKTSRH